MKLAVIIGRMQFLHNGHVSLFKKALEVADSVLVLVGSSDKAPDPKNPFTFEQREEIIFNTFRDLGADNYTISVRPLPDFYLDEQWYLAVHQAVNNFSLCQMPETGELIKDKDVILIGHEKDASSYYLNQFPQWTFLNVPNERGISSTDFRNDLFKRKGATDLTFIQRLEKFLSSVGGYGTQLADIVRERLGKDPDLWHAFSSPQEELKELDVTYLKLNTPPSMHQFIEDYIKSPEYLNMVEEQEQYDSDKLSWGLSPYPPVFVTTDAVVTHKSSILLIRRKNHPGKGLWALPGGFLGPEWIRDSIIRELREETKIEVLNSDLLRIMSPIQVFDKPDRSLRGRTITHAARFNLDHLGLEERPKVRADDDAEEVRWFSFGEIQSSNGILFEDHREIINRLVFSRG